MRGLRQGGLGISLLIAFLLGCSEPAPRAPVHPASPVPGTGVIRLSSGESGLSAQAVTSFASASIQIDGASMAASRSTVTAFSLGGGAVTLYNAPAGRNMVVTITGLDASGGVLSGSRFGTTVDVLAGTTTAAIVNPQSTLRAQVVTALLEADRIAGRDAAHSFAARLDAHALQVQLEAERSRLGVLHPCLFDAIAIAANLAQGSDPGATTVLTPALGNCAPYVQEPGRVRLMLKGLPAASRATVWLDDPLSPKQANLPVGGAEVTPVAPGTWILRARASNGDVASAAVTVLPGVASAEVTLDLSRWTSLPNLPKALAGTAYATMPLGAVAAIVMAGGVDRSVISGLSAPFATDSCYAFDGTQLTALPSLPVALSYAAGTSCAGKLYVFGGMKSDRTQSSDVYCFDGVQWGAPVASFSLGNVPMRFSGGIAGTIGSTIYVFGGTYGGLAKAFNVFTNALTDCAAMSSQRTVPAAVVHQGKIYVFGGMNNQDFLASCEVFDPVTGAWSSLAAMPQARYGAQAIPFENQIYVIGGMEQDRRPSARVDVYDPATDAWTPFSALNTPRGAVALGVLNNKLHVLGGSDGLYYHLFGSTPAAKPFPTAAVEVLRP